MKTFQIVQILKLYLMYFFFFLQMSRLHRSKQGPCVCMCNSLYSHMLSPVGDMCAVVYVPY